MVDINISQIYMQKLLCILAVLDDIKKLRPLFYVTVNYSGHFRFLKAWNDWG